MRNQRRVSSSKIAKSLVLLLICSLTIYAPVELTRVIIAYGLSGKLIFEVCFVWSFYAIAILLISAVLARRPPFE